jgi:hypothetical protein
LAPERSSIRQFTVESATPSSSFSSRRGRSAEVDLIAAYSLLQIVPLNA